MLVIRIIRFVFLGSMAVFTSSSASADEVSYKSYWNCMQTIRVLAKAEQFATKKGDTLKLGGIPQYGDQTDSEIVVPLTKAEDPGVLVFTESVPYFFSFFKPLNSTGRSQILSYPADITTIDTEKKYIHAKIYNRKFQVPRSKEGPQYAQFELVGTESKESVLPGLAKNNKDKVRSTIRMYAPKDAPLKGREHLYRDDKSYYFSMKEYPASSFVEIEGYDYWNSVGKAEAENVLSNMIPFLTRKIDAIVSHWPELRNTTKLNYAAQLEKCQLSENLKRKIESHLNKTIVQYERVVNDSRVDKGSSVGADSIK